MMKNYLTLLPLLAFLFGNTQANGQSCLPTFQYNADGNMITHVQFATINNTSPFTSGTTTSHEDFTSQSATVNAGESYPISVKAPSSTFPSDIMVYIDFNQNGSFADAGESFYIGRVEAANPANANTVNATIIVPSTAIAGTTKMRVLKNSNVDAYNNPSAPNSISGPCATNLRSGQTEDYSVSIVATQVCGEPANAPGSLGCVTFNYRGTLTTLTTVRGTDGKIWLQQNLGSENVATSETDATAYGDLFQWGRWDDGHQIRTSETSSTAPNPNNPTGLGSGNANFLTGSAQWWKTGLIADKWENATPEEVTENNGCDPCKALGNGWSLPTLEEWTAIVSSEQITNIATAYTSHLKLTVAGNRNASGGFNFVGQRGYYWSNSTTTTTGYAKHLYYSNAIVNASSGSYRELGMSVRCLKAASSLGTGEFTKSKFKLYPNPVSSTLNIEVDSEIETVSIYNQIGQLVLKAKSNSVDVSNLTSGIYLVQTQLKDGTTNTDRIIKK